MEVRLLGGFSVVVAEQGVPAAAWKRRKAAAIVKLLALAPGHQMHRDQVIEALWPEVDPEQGSNNLYQSLHAARRAIDPTGQQESLIVLRDQILSFSHNANVHIDIDAFEAAVVAARRTNDLEDFRTAIRLYTGELLPHDRYEPWASERRDALRESFFSMAMDAANAMQGSDDDVGAIDVARRALTVDPLHEPAHRALIWSYARSGQRQRAIRQYETLRDALESELNVEPEPETEQLLALIRSGQIEKAHPSSTDAVTDDRPRHNLPAPTSSFIGRDREILEVRHLLGRTRLLTLQGPGGCGKTRLSLQVGREVMEEYRDGVWLVELAALNDPVLLPQAIATALDVRELPGQPLIDTLTAWLRNRQLLLILDNCEHLIDASAQIAELLLRTHPDLRILTTSREPLRLSGEITWLVPSLGLPDLSHRTTTDQIQELESVQLFIDRARGINPTFELTDQSARAVAELCVRLDGIPLALELAAARTRALSVLQIVERLDDRFRLLSSGSRAAMSRQQTLRAALDWSYDLLTEPERILFDRLSVFAGEFDLSAAESISAEPPLDRLGIVDLLGQLVDRSLVVAVTAYTDTTIRYRLLETMREYGRERLEQRGERDTFRRAHAHYYASIAKTGDRALRGVGQNPEHWLRQLEREHDNFRAALEWFREPPDSSDLETGLEMAGALHWFWHRGGHFTEGRRWLNLLIRAAGPSTRTTSRASALTGSGVLAVTVGDYTEGDTILREAVSLWHGADNQSGLPLALAWLGWVALFHGNLSEARALHQEALDLFEDHDDTWGIALAADGLGFDAAEQDDLDAARIAFDRGLSGFREAGDNWGIATTLHQIANLSYRAGDFDDARRQAEEVLALDRRMGDRWLENSVLGLLGEIARAQGDIETAAAMTDAVFILARDYGQLATHGWTLRDAGFIAFARGDIDTAIDYFRDGLRHFHTHDYPLGIVCCLVGMAGVAVERGNPQLAAILLRTTRTTLQHLSLSLAPADRHEAARIDQLVLSALGWDSFDLINESSTTASLDDAIALVEASLLA